MTERASYTGKPAPATTVPRSPAAAAIGLLARGAARAGPEGLHTAAGGADFAALHGRADVAELLWRWADVPERRHD